MLLFPKPRQCKRLLVIKLSRKDEREKREVIITIRNIVSIIHIQNYYCILENYGK